jgi:hypothetical protein
LRAASCSGVIAADLTAPFIAPPACKSRSRVVSPRRQTAAHDAVYPIARATPMGEVDDFLAEALETRIDPCWHWRRDRRAR